MVYLFISLAALGGGCIAHYTVSRIQEWLCEKERAEQQVAQYIRILTDENEYYKFTLGETQAECEQLREALETAMKRELEWLDERKKLLERLNFAVREMALDDMDRKTKVIKK